MKPWTPLRQDDIHDCLEPVAACLVGAQEPLTIPGERCSWLETQIVLRRTHGVQLRHDERRVVSPRGEPHHGVRAMVGITDTQLGTSPHAVICQRDHDGVLRVTHDPARDVPADRYPIVRLASIERAPAPTEPFDTSTGCWVNGCNAWQWHGY